MNLCSETNGDSVLSNPGGLYPGSILETSQILFMECYPQDEFLTAAQQRRCSTTRSQSHCCSIYLAPPSALLACNPRQHTHVPCLDSFLLPPPPPLLLLPRPLHTPPVSRTHHHTAHTIPCRAAAAGAAATAAAEVVPCAAAAGWHADAA